jgi:heme A synthase
LPDTSQLATVIEVTHRASVGILAILGVILLVWAFRAYPAGHRVRWGAVASIFFLVTESLIGAGLVLLELVAFNVSLERAFWASGHLVNTFLLTAAFTLTAWWASGGKPIRWREQGGATWLLGTGLLLLLLLGATGAVTALGATLFPAGSIAEGVAQDLSSNSPVLLRLRLVHPAISVGVGLYLLVVAVLIQQMRPGPDTKRFALGLVALFVVQILVGLVNLALHAPVALQMVHLLLANALWIDLVLLTAAAFAVEAPPLRQAQVVPQPGS